MANYPALSDNERIQMALTQTKSIDRPVDSELRVLICTATYFVLDGVTLTIRRLVDHLRANGVKVKILSTVPDNIEPERVQDVIIIPGIKIPFAHAGEYAFGVGLDDHTQSQIEHFNPNIVHFTVPDLVALETIKWCQHNNVAYIGTWHSNYVDYLKYYYIEWILGGALLRYLRGFYEQIPNVYVPTKYMLNKMRNDMKFGTCTELKMWGRGVDMDIFSPARRSETFRRSKGFTNEDIVILWVGRLVPEKRPDIWLNTVKKLQDEGYPVKAMVVGSGSFEKYLSRLKFITCCGWLSGANLGEAYASADILVFPSDVETFGNVSLEALSSGCPAIVEKKCGEHLVQDNINGYTCLSNSFEEFYEATKKLVVDKDLREQFSKSARESSRKFERKIILQQMAENYKDAIEKHRDPALMKRHLENPAGNGVNVLSILCCNFWLVRKLISPFLNTTRVVQDFADNTAECVSLSRSRLSCQSGEWEAALADEEIGSPMYGSGSGKYGVKEKKPWFKGELCMRWYRNCNIPCFGYLCVSKLFRIAAFLFSLCLMLCVVYFSFTI